MLPKDYTVPRYTATCKLVQYTPNEARFLALTEEHGCYFVPRQYGTFLGGNGGQRQMNFIRKVVDCRDARPLEYRSDRIVYQLINGQRRKPHGPALIKRRLMGLDHRLEHGDGHPEECVFVDEGRPTYAGFRGFLIKHHQRFMQDDRALCLVYVTDLQARTCEALRIFESLTLAERILQSDEYLQRLIVHFRVRRAITHGRPSDGLDTPEELHRYREDQERFVREIEEVYPIWDRYGVLELARALRPEIAAEIARKTAFVPCVLHHDYDLFSGETQ